ncbi:MAG: carbohydrate porin [Cyanobacteriota bacterium]|nr:carbohydrate porin [Cyanobacteriota bacterium]
MRSADTALQPPASPVGASRFAGSSLRRPGPLATVLSLALVSGLASPPLGARAFPASPSAAGSSGQGQGPNLREHSISPLGAQAFTPTTTVRVEMNGVVGALHYTGNAMDRGANTAAGFPLLNALTFNQDWRLTLDTSFTGQDLFRVRLRGGNFGASGFFSNPPTPLTRLDVAFQEPLCASTDDACDRNLVTVNRAYLQVPLGAAFRVSVGSRLMQRDILPVWPSAYTDAPILELLQRAGAAGAYSRRVGSGFGVWWQPEGALRGLTLATAFIVPRGANGSPERGGWFTAGNDQTGTVQLAFTRPAWNLTAAYTRNGERALLRGTPLASQLAADSHDGALHSWSLAGYWQPSRPGWIPAISAGWGLDRFAFASFPVPELSGVRTISWSVGLSWVEAFGSGNSLSLALGAPAHVTRLEGLAGLDGEDPGLAFELATRIRISDGFSVTPAVFWLTRPRGGMATTASLGEALGHEGTGEAGSLGVWGALVRGTLRF